VHDCVSQTDRGILSPLLKSYKAILDSQLSSPSQDPHVFVYESSGLKI